METKMESKLLEFYAMPKSDRREYVANLSDAELVNLMNDTTSCFKTLEELIDTYDALDQQKKKGNRPFIGIWWLIKKEAKKEWEEACRAAESEINKKERAIICSYIWKLLDIEKDAILAQYPRFDKEDILIRSYAAVNLKLKIKGEVIPVLLAESETRK